MDISDKIYDILVREVDRLDVKQRTEGLSRDDVSILSTLTSTAVSIKRATPERRDPAEDLDYEQLMSAALAPLREVHPNERAGTAETKPSTGDTSLATKTQPSDPVGYPGATAPSGSAAARPTKPRRRHGQGGS